MTTTRLVAQFSELQSQWFDAVKKKEAAALDRLLGEDFEAWTPSHSGPIPREEWQAQAFAANLKSAQWTEIAVKTLRVGTAVESSRLQAIRMRAGVAVTEHFFVVNIWTTEKGSWRCIDSYASPIPQEPPKDVGLVKSERMR